MKRKRTMTGLDLKHEIDELGNLVGKIVKKVYMIREGVYSLAFYPEVLGCRELIIDVDGYVFLTDLKWQKPTTPPPFVMALRKRLEGRRIEGVEQVGVERILKLKFSGEEEMALIAELFGGGNLIVETDGSIDILLRPLEVRGRILKRGKPYKPPESVFTGWPDRGGIEDHIKGSVGKPLWSALTSMGIGPPYIDDVSLEVGLGARDPIPEDEDLVRKIVEAIWSLIERDRRPVVYKEGEEIVNFAPFPLRSIKARHEEMDYFWKAIQSYYIGTRLEAAPDRRVESLKKEIERQLRLREEYAREAEESKLRGDLIFSHLAQVEQAIESARRGESHEIIVDLDRSSGKAVIKLEGVRIQLDILKSAPENASIYYDRYKKLSEKHRRIESVLKELEERLKSEETAIAEREIVRERKKRRWYEKFRWFFTPSGKLVIAGRDAQTNEEIVARYMEDRDLFFHTDMPGGAVVVLKTGGEPDKESISLAAAAAGCFSRAWREGLAYADVFYVEGAQVSRHAPPGLYLPRGSFYIVGKRSYLRVKLELCVGIQQTPDGPKVTAAPPGAPFLVCTRVRPGDLRKEQAAKILREKLEEAVRRNILRGEGEISTAGEFRVDIDDVMRALPPGRFRIEE